VKGVSVEAINEAAKSKPEGYLEDVMSYVVERRDGLCCLKTTTTTYSATSTAVTLTRWCEGLERNYIGC
jgi:hypothetical protein